MIEDEARGYWRACRSLQQGVAKGRSRLVREAVADLEGIAMCSDLHGLRRRAMGKLLSAARALSRTASEAAITAAQRIGALADRDMPAPDDNRPLGSLVCLADARVKRLGHPPGTVRRAKLGRRGHGKQISTPPEL